MPTFQKGVSGNPKGTRTGSKHKATLIADKLLKGEIDEVVRAVIAAAKGGDMAACRLVLERILPPCKPGRTVKLALPAVNSSTDLIPALGSITSAVGRGLITPEEGQHLATIFEQQRRAIETVELEERIARLEGKHAP
jgi:Family of unknown function (DUF5681)